MVEFQANPNNYLSATSERFGPELHALIANVELPKPAAAEVRRVKKIAPVKFSRMRDMQDFGVVQCALLAGDDDQRSIGYEIARLLTNVGFTNYTLYEPVSSMIRHAAYVAARHGDRKAFEPLEAHLWTPQSSELETRYNSVGHDLRGIHFLSILERSDPMSHPNDYYTMGKRGVSLRLQFLLETSYLSAAADFGIRGGNKDWPVERVDQAYDDHLDRLHRVLAGESLIPRGFGHPFPHEAVDLPPRTAGGPAPASGWYTDPLDREGHKRWWNGERWTDHIHPGHRDWKPEGRDQPPPELLDS